MNAFDVSVSHWANQFAQRSFAFDSLVYTVSRTDLYKGGVFITLLWLLWFSSVESRSKQRTIISTVVACLGGLLLARVLAEALPFRLRPYHNPNLGFIVPLTVKPENFDGMSSFPSDHAVYFFALATGICFISRRLGLFALLHAVFVICLTRLYLGMHYATDLLAGAGLGIAIAIIGSLPAVAQTVSRPVFAWIDKHPASFYAAFFVLSFEMAEMFNGVRKLGNALVAAISH